MNPSEKRVAGEGSKNSGDDAGNLQPQPHTVLLGKVCDLFFRALCETSNEGEKKNVGKGVEVGEGSSTKVDQVVNEATVGVHEKDLADWIEITDKEERENDVVMVEDNNEGVAGVEAEVAPDRFIGIDLNRSPPQEED